MKNYFALLLLVTVLYSCKEDVETANLESEKTTIIAGKVTLADSVAIDKLTVYLYDYLATDYHEYSGDLSTDGSFRIEIPMAHPAEMTLVANTPFSLIAVPGDSIHVAFSASSDNSSTSKTVYTFTGDRSETNNRLMEYNEQFPLDLQRFYDSEEATALQEFLTYADDSQETLEDFNSNFIKESDEQMLVDYIKAQEKYYLPTTRLDFANYRSYYGLESPDANGGYYDFVEDIPSMKTKDLVNTGTVQRLIYNLTYHLRSLARATAGEGMDGDDAMDIKAIEIATAGENEGMLYDYVIHDLVYNSLSDHNLAVYEKSMELIENSVVNTTIKTSITAKYEEEKALLKSPELPEGAELLTFESQNPENYLDEIIVNANGKVIYIDNWATWCGPCKVEFKEASPQLHEKFKEDVEFVYFCHNSERQAYIPSIAQFQIKGKHYFLEPAASEIIARQINLEGFPTYTIINKEGKVVQSDYIHRPSYPPTTDLLTKLVNE